MEEQIAKINHLDRISSRNLSEEALQLFRSVLAIVIGEERREPQRENAEVMRVEEVEEVREEERREEWQLPARI